MNDKHRLRLIFSYLLLLALLVFATRSIDDPILTIFKWMVAGSVLLLIVGHIYLSRAEEAQFNHLDNVIARFGIDKVRMQLLEQCEELEDRIRQRPSVRDISLYLTKKEDLNYVLKRLRESEE